MSLEHFTSELSDAIGAGIAGFPRAEADRAVEALRRLAAPGIAGGVSGLTGDGFPLELAFTTADPALRWTFDPAPDGASPADRLDIALDGLARLGAPLEAGLAKIATGLQARREDGFGAWVAGRHDADGDRFKLYVDLPDGADAEAALRALDIPRPRLAGTPPRTRMLGFGPGPDRIEGYFRVEATRLDLLRLLEPAGRADEAGRLVDLIADAWGHTIRDRLPGGQVGVSYARVGTGTPIFTLFLVARTLWGGDARVRERMLERLAAAGAPVTPYAVASAPFAARRSAQTRHGLVGLVLAPGGIEWGVGLRPMVTPC